MHPRSGRISRRRCGVVGERELTNRYCHSTVRSRFAALRGLSSYLFALLLGYRVEEEAVCEERWRYLFRIKVV